MAASCACVNASGLVQIQCLSLAHRKLLTPFTSFRYAQSPPPLITNLQDRSQGAGVSAGLTCPDRWIGYRGKCYYFSEAERNWTYSLTYCSALSASLAEINSEQEMAFLLRYKGRFDHWIGLQRDPGQLWKWANGTKFNNLFPIGEGGTAHI
ncbi:C-type lectin domain family 2 member D-like [Chelonia mydas]|uniref:C-type lectin domain family 2 member D-like n=1 Tax=Chelonia mydas TaxID=8469 RepID=UPI001CA8EFE5|nr:C-type lectin domain family 2 member D-like [Chelonia mydas]